MKKVYILFTDARSLGRVPMEDEWWKQIVGIYANRANAEKDLPSNTENNVYYIEEHQIEDIKEEEWVDIHIDIKNMIKL